MLIENTAGGDGAMARGLDAIARLWDAVGDAAGGGGEVGLLPGHLPRASPPARTWPTVVDRVKAITGRIDLVHCNNSRDEFGSGRDRHAGLESGQIDPALLVDVVRSAGARRDLRDARRGSGRSLAARQAELAGRSDSAGRATGAAGVTGAVTSATRAERAPLQA